MSHRSRSELEGALRHLEGRLRRDASLDLLQARAELLDRLGRAEEARLGYVEVLRKDPEHFAALTGLGMLLNKSGNANDATTCFLAAVTKHPHNPLGHANFAYMLLRGGDAAGARKHYAMALELEPGNLEAHRGLALALSALGDETEAQVHREAGFVAQPLARAAYRGEGAPVRVLLLVAAGPGNTRADVYLDDRVFEVAKLVAEYDRDDVELPPHDFVFNAVSDADNSAEALTRVEAVLARTDAPVVNAPAAVRATGRVENAARLRALDDVIAPRMTRMPKAALCAADAAERLRDRGVQIPLLLRSPGFHAGANFERVERAGDLAAVAASLPGDDLLAIEYLDVRGADGNVRKYRAMCVAGELFPLHLAIARQWKVHYFSADMTESAAHRAEDAAYLNDMRGTLGERAMVGLARVAALLGLDYAGIDFGLDRDGRAVIFEANGTMVVPIPQPDPRWEYRRAPVQRIHDAVRAMLLAKAGRSGERDRSDRR